MRVSVARVRALAAAGLSQRDAARELGVTRGVIRALGVSFHGAVRYRRRAPEEAQAWLSARLASAQCRGTSSS